MILIFMLPMNSKVVVTGNKMSANLGSNFFGMYLQMCRCGSFLVRNTKDFLELNFDY